MILAAKDNMYLKGIWLHERQVLPRRKRASTICIIKSYILISFPKLYHCKEEKTSLWTEEYTRL